MTGMTRLFVLAVLLGVISGAFRCAVAAAQTPPAPPPAVAAIDGEPAELHDLAVQLQQLHNAGKGAEVRALCQQHYDADPNPEHRAYFMWYIGRSWAKEYKYDTAIPIYQQVLAQFPNSGQDWWVRYYLGRAYCDRARVGNGLENLNLALSTLNQLVKDHPSPQKASHPLKYIGWCYERLGDGQAAVAAYLKAYELYPTSSDVHSCLSRVVDLLQRQERWDEAITWARRYVQLFPEKKYATRMQYAVGMSLAGKGDLAQASVEFDRLVSLYPNARNDCAKALYQKGLAQKMAGQAAAARSTFSQLVTDYPDEYMATRAKVELASMGAQ